MAKHSITDFIVDDEEYHSLAPGYRSQISNATRTAHLET